jgi:hypothetical protein
MTSLGELLDDLGAERRQVVRTTAGDQPVVGHDLLVDDVCLLALRRHGD